MRGLRMPTQKESPPGIMKIGKMGFCHRDIKPENVLYDPTKNKHSLIDFGLMGELKNVFRFSQFALLNYRYIYYPPEFSLAAYLYANRNLQSASSMLYHIRDPSNIEQLKQKLFENVTVGQFMNYYRVFQVKKDAEMRSFLDSVIRYLDSNKNQNASKEYVINDMLFTMAKSKIDVYGLGIAWTQMYYFGKKIIDKNEHFEELLGEMTCLDPKKRITCQNIIHRINDIKESYGELPNVDVNNNSNSTNQRIVTVAAPVRPKNRTRRTDARNITTEATPPSRPGTGVINAMNTSSFTKQRGGKRVVFTKLENYPSYKSQNAGKKSQKKIHRTKKI